MRWGGPDEVTLEPSGGRAPAPSGSAGTGGVETTEDTAPAPRASPENPQDTADSHAPEAPAPRTEDDAVAAAAATTTAPAADEDSDAPADEAPAGSSADAEAPAEAETSADAEVDASADAPDEGGSDDRRDTGRSAGTGAVAAGAAGTAALAGAAAATASPTSDTPDEQTTSSSGTATAARDEQATASSSGTTTVTAAESTDVMDPVREEPAPAPAEEPRPGVVRDRRRRRRVLGAFVVAALVLAAFLALIALLTAHDDQPARPAAAAPSPAAPPAPPPVPSLPRGGITFFPQYRVVAYYGTAGTDRLGVLGAGTPEQAAERLEQAAAPFATPGKTIQPAMELIVSVANSTPGSDGTYHSDIDSSEARQYLAAARAHRQELIIDIQPGRADFYSAVQPWAALLREPDVSLALDPEWRMGPNEIPGETIGSVSADEVNQVSSWLAAMVQQNNLPQKLFVLHQFTPDMITNPERLATPPQLAVVQHIDGFGAPPNKLSKYQELQRPGRLHEGFKLFYTQDTPMLTPQQALSLQPVPDLITYQ